MTEPTLTELREMADEIVQHVGRIDEKYGVTDMLEDFGLRIAKAFLALTDPQPLNVLQVQAIGLEQDNENKHEYGDADSPTSLVSVLMGRDHVAINLQIGDPTVGQLRLALMQENRDGE